jgi:hypothetical protein
LLDCLNDFSFRPRCYHSVDNFCFIKELYGYYDVLIRYLIILSFSV